MRVELIANEKDYDAAVKRIEKLMGAGADTPEGEELDALVTVVCAYEEVRFPMDEPDPEVLARFQKEQQG